GLGIGVHGERREPVDLRRLDPGVGAGGDARLQRELELAAARGLGELRRADADHRGPPGVAMCGHDAACPVGSSSSTVPATCRPRELLATTEPVTVRCRYGYAGAPRRTRSALTSASGPAQSVT